MWWAKVLRHGWERRTPVLSVFVPSRSRVSGNSSISPLPTDPQVLSVHMAIPTATVPSPSQSTCTVPSCSIQDISGVHPLLRTYKTKWEIHTKKWEINIC